MEKDSLLDELADAIAQGPVIFTPDDSWEEKLEEARSETQKYSIYNTVCEEMASDYLDQVDCCKVKTKLRHRQESI